MSKFSKNQKGFTAVEGLLAVLIIVVIGAVGYMIYHNNHKAKDASVSTPADKPTTSSSAKSTVAVNPYAGWNTFTLKYEQATFKYPADWKLTLGNATTSGSDSVQLSGTNNFVLNIETGGLGHPSFDGPAPVLSAVPVTFLGNKGYLDETSTSNDSKVEEVSLSQSATEFLDTFPSKASGENQTPGGNFMIYGEYYINNHTTEPSDTASQATTDINYKDTELIIESMHY